MFASMQLGGEKETIEQTQIGAIQLLRVSVGSLGPIVHGIMRSPVPGRMECRPYRHYEKARRLNGGL